MEIVVETGAGLPTANSWISVVDAGVLMANTPYFDAWDNSDEDNQKLFLVASTEYLSRRFRHYGQALTRNQGTPWPRTKNYDSQGNLLDAGIIPKELKEAQAILAGIFAADPEEMLDLFEGKSNIRSWATEGLSITFDNTTTTQGQNLSAAAAEQLMGQRYTMIEILLRSFAVRKDAAWLNDTQQSEVRVALT